MSVQLKGRQGTTRELDQTEVFELLGNDRRRHALHHLMTREEGCNIGELSRQIAAWETGQTVDEVTSAERRRVYVSLHQTHLPRLNKAGILNYESTGDTIHLTDRGENLRVYMEVVEGNDIPWSVFYLGLSTLGASLLLASWVGASPFNVIPPLGVATIVVTLFLLASASHVFVTRRRRLGAGEKPPELQQ
jgi:hypothetical protein